MNLYSDASVFFGAKGELAAAIKVITKNRWFVARPSGTENIYKIYSESVLRKDHLRRILEEAQAIVKDALKGAISQDKHAA